MNKNVSTGAVIRAGRSFINYWRTIIPVVTSLGLRAAGTEESDSSLSFMNTLTDSIHSSVTTEGHGRSTVSNAL